MKVEKVREKDGKLELLVELSPAETAEEMQRAAGNEIAKRGAGQDDLKASGVTPSEFLANLVGASEASFLIDEGIMRRRAPFALTAERVDTIGAPVYRCSEHAQIGKPFKYQLVCVPVPEYELESYDPVSISVPSYEVKTEEIDAEIDRMVQFAATGMTDTSHDEVMKGDKVELAMQTTMDGAPVNVAIALLIPGAQAGTTHLKILSKVAEALMDEDFRATVKGSTDAAEIAKTINARLV